MRYFAGPQPKVSALFYWPRRNTPIFYYIILSISEK